MEEGVEGSGGGGGLGRKIPAGEVELKEKSGTAWSHSFLNQKPWHPLSYPNQRRKWIAEQIHTNRARRDEEVQREFAQEQEFFRQTALFSKKDKEKMEIMKAVSFMYVRPPGYNPESAKAAEIQDEKKKLDQGDAAEDAVAANTSSMPDDGPEKKKSRPKDVFGRSLPTEQEFEVLKNAPRLDTGAPARPKPFGVEVRNVRCLRCGNFGHQSGDRECPMKDIIMPNEESRLKRDDPLTAIKAQTDSSEPLKWELKQKPGMSPPRGGYNPDDPNQQIVAEEIFDEYGGFLGDIDIPALLTNFSTSKSKKRSKSKSRRRQSEPAAHVESGRHHSSHHSSSDSEPEKSNRASGSKRKKNYCSDPSSYSDSEAEAGKGKAKQKSKHRNRKKHLLESSSESEVEVDTRRHPKREHRKKKKKEEMEIAPVSSSRDKGYTISKRPSRRSREKQPYSDSSSSESEQQHPTRWQDKQSRSDSSSSESKRHSRRSREKRHHKMPVFPVSNRSSRKLDEKWHYTDSSARESDRHSRKPREKSRYSDPSASEYSDSDRPSRRSNEKRHYTDLSTHGSDRHSRKPKGKSRCSDLSASEYSDSDRRNSHRRRRRK
ncbi:hypothetical protein ACQJBY_065862 [Aegilops geniculata]